MSEKEEIEEGEVASDEEKIEQNDEKLLKNKSDVESGEITDDERNNYDDEDEDVLELRYELLQSMAEGNDKQKEKTDLKRKKSKIKKKKRRTISKKQQKTSSKSSSASSLGSLRRESADERIRKKLSSYASLITPSYTKQNDNYEIQDMEIDTVETPPITAATTNNNLFEGLADKDMRQDFPNHQKQDQNKISMFELMIDYNLNTYSISSNQNLQNQPLVISPPLQSQQSVLKQHNSFYSNDPFPKKYFEYQSISVVHKQNKPNLKQIEPKPNLIQIETKPNLVQVEINNNNNFNNKSRISPPLRQNQALKQKNSFNHLNKSAKKPKRMNNFIVIESNENKQNFDIINSINNETLIENSDKVNQEKDSGDDEVDIDELRDNLLNELNQKRAQKVLEDKKEDEVVENNKKNNYETFDMSHYETTIQLARKQIEEAKTLANTLQQQQQQVNRLQQNSNNSSNNNTNNRINPIIIKIRQNETSSDEDDSDGNSDVEIKQVLQTKNRLKTTSAEDSATFQSNISLFLNAAKEQAKLEIQKQQQVNSGDNSVTSTTSTLPMTSFQAISNVPETLSLPSSNQISSPAKLSATIKRLKETRKDEIRFIRDKINAKSKEITDWNKKSIETRQLVLKKTKDINLSKEKIRLLKEQLLAAEKILQVNEESVKDLKLKQKNFDSKLMKLKEVKKKQQERLQQLLASSNETPTQIPIQTPKLSINVEAIKSDTRNVVSTTQSPRTVLNKAVNPSQFSSTINNSHENRRIVLNEPSTPSPIQNQKITTSVTPTSPAALQSIQSIEKPTQIIETPVALTKPIQVIDPDKSKDVASIKQVVNVQSLKTVGSSGSLVQNVVMPQQTIASNQPQPSTVKTNPNKISSLDLDRLVVNKSPIINNDLKERIDNLKLKSLIKENKSNNSPNTSTTPLISSSFTTNISSNIRPKIYVSKQTNQKLQQIAIDKYTHNLAVSNKLNTQPPHNTTSITINNSKDNKIFNVKKNELKENLVNKQLIDLVDSLTKDYPYIHLNSNSIANKDLIVNKDFKLVFNNLNEYLMKDNVSLSESSTETVKINDVLNYESPLLMFKGYRFNKHFCDLNNFETAYSKFYCNSIDIRKPFCPFDLNGSCKDSNCTYQHSSVMTMDNLQRTEHFLSYCPELINVTEGLSQKESIKRLRNYSKTFMSNNLNKMSIKDYFKYLYDEIMKKRKFDDQSCLTILKRIPSLIINNNKSIGAYEEQNYDLDKHTDSLEKNEPSCLKNLDRLNRFKYKCMDESLKDYLNDNPNDINGWLYYSNMKLKNNNNELVLNALSQALEVNANCEQIWIEYLHAYSNVEKLKDYNEVCLLAIDNCPTYKVFWKILLTINVDFMDEIIDRFQKYLIETKFQNEDKSFYLCELIIYHVYIKLIYNSDLNVAKSLFMKYLRTDEVCSNTRLEHNCILWLYVIYLHAFGYLPKLWFHEDIPGRVYKLVPFVLPWSLNSKFICETQAIHQLIGESLEIFRNKTFLIDENSTSRLNQKQILNYGLTIYENLIIFEISLKKYSNSLKICDRLLKADPTLTDIWLLKLHVSLFTTNMDEAIEAALKACPFDAQIHLNIAQYFISLNENEDAIKLLEKLIYNYYDFDLINDNFDADFLYREILNYKKSSHILNQNQLIFKLKPIITQDYIESQLLNINISYWFDFFSLICEVLYLHLQSSLTASALIDETFKFAFEKFTKLDEHIIIWTRYLKYIAISNEFNFHSIYPYIKSCFDDLNSFATKNTNNDELTANNIKLEITTNQLIIIECLLKYCRTNKEKYNLLKYLLQLIPTNTELIKWFTNYLVKENTPKYQLQYLYDHLIINSVKNDSLWILCIKMCLDQNDLQQV